MTSNLPRWCWAFLCAGLSWLLVQPDAAQSQASKVGGAAVKPQAKKPAADRPKPDQPDQPPMVKPKPPGGVQGGIMAGGTAIQQGHQGIGQTVSSLAKSGVHGQQLAVLIHQMHQAKGKGGKGAGGKMAGGGQQKGGQQQKAIQKGGQPQNVVKKGGHAAATVGAQGGMPGAAAANIGPGPIQRPNIGGPQGKGKGKGKGG
jgi:hypothetical protein